MEPGRSLVAQCATLISRVLFVKSGETKNFLIMDAGMNDTFVKVSKAGKRYYYPASQEFGFQIANRTTLAVRGPAAPKRNRVPGKFFMNDTFIDYIPAFQKEAEALVDKVVGE